MARDRHTRLSRLSMAAVFAAASACAHLPVEVPRSDRFADDDAPNDSGHVSNYAVAFYPEHRHHGYVTPTAEERSTIEDVLKAYAEKINVNFRVMEPDSIEKTPSDYYFLRIGIKKRLFDDGGREHAGGAGQDDNGDDIIEVAREDPKDRDVFMTNVKHELGHILGLGHADPDARGSETVMQPRTPVDWRDIDPNPGPGKADLKTLVHIWGARAPAPAAATMPKPLKR
jgi:hypothetical protein